MGPPAPLAFDEARRRIGTLGIATLLAAAGGFLDGFTWVGHGHVFANAMTGNVVLLPSNTRFAGIGSDGESTKSSTNGSSGLPPAWVVVATP